MRRKHLPSSATVLIVILTLLACGEPARRADSSGPVVVVSSQPTETSASVAASPAIPSAHAPPSATPMPPTLTKELAQERGTPSPTPPATTFTTTPAMIATTPPAPTLTPTTPPEPTPSPRTGPTQVADLATIRLELQEIVGGLDTPVGIVSAGDGSDRLFILEKPGRIRSLQAGSLAEVPFLDLTDRVGASQSEQGLLGLAFHPLYAENGLFYVDYTNLQGNTVVSRFIAGADPNRADASSETILLTLTQPAANHNGGHLAFGPDGYLYIGTGDGGAAGDRFGNGQNGATLLGAMLRLDVDHDQPYAIPPDNPFVGDPAVLDEIWAIGLRNPWRYSFDSLTGDLYIADVGQNQYEEINIQPVGSAGGQNYGWPIMEGVHCFPEDQACDQTGLTPPVVEYEHSQGCSVTGGYVYRGEESPFLAGVYLFGDYCTGRIWGLIPTDHGWATAELAQADTRISSFGQDSTGELYLLGMDKGALFKIVARKN